MIKLENKQNGRYYYLFIQKDLFNHDVLIVVRGGVHHHVIRTYGYPSESVIEAKIRELIKRRLTRGYTFVSN
jgi:hypothetical protein